MAELGPVGTDAAAWRHPFLASPSQEQGLSSGQEVKPALTGPRSMKPEVADREP